MRALDGSTSLDNFHTVEPAEVMTDVSAHNLTRLCPMDSFVLINWMSPFVHKRVSGVVILNCFYFILVDLMQTVQIEIRRHKMRRLDWICPVCQYSFYESLGINGLT